MGENQKSQCASCGENRWSSDPTSALRLSILARGNDQMVDERRCIYCTELKSPSVFSTEHIVPRFLGGNAECAAAATDDVCQDCNSLFGRHVDAAVARGYFLNSIEQGAWRGCFDYDELRGNIYPLTYFGKNTELKVGQQEDVEVWLCPDGGTAWHIHTKQPGDFSSLSRRRPSTPSKGRLKPSLQLQCLQSPLLDNIEL